MGKKLDLRVVWHPSGNRTLMQSLNGGATYSDLKGKFFCNSDAAEFYRAVANLIAIRAGRGYQVVYQDTSAD